MTLVFDNNFLATDANLIFLSKIDKELKGVVDFFPFLRVFKRGAIGWKFQHFDNCYFLLFPICI